MTRRQTLGILLNLLGEKFCIVCNYSPSIGIVDNIENIREAVERLEIAADNGDIIKFTISEGVAKASDEMKKT